MLCAPLIAGLNSYPENLAYYRALGSYVPIVMNRPTLGSAGEKGFLRGGEVLCVGKGFYVLGRGPFQRFPAFFFEYEGARKDSPRRGKRLRALKKGSLQL